MRYQSAPRNIYRHIILSEMKEATAALPLVRGPDGVRAVPPRAVRWHSRPSRAGGRWARLKPQPPARNAHLTSRCPLASQGSTRGLVPPRPRAVRLGWLSRASVLAAAGGTAFTPSFFSLIPLAGGDLAACDGVRSLTSFGLHRLLHPTRKVPPPPLGAALAQPAWSWHTLSPGCMWALGAELLLLLHLGGRAAWLAVLTGRQDWSCCFPSVVTIGRWRLFTATKAEAAEKRWLFLS